MVLKKFLNAFYLLTATVFISNITLTVCAQQSQYTPSIGVGPAKFRVVLDPGHGGRDSATHVDGFYEKDIVLSIAKEIKQHLVQSGFEVVMTRDTDVFISLSERAAITGDVFISLHVNTVSDTIGPSVRTMIKGIEIYTDNVINDTDLFDKSKLLSTMFQKQLTALQGIKLRGVKQKSLAVLNKNLSPAILIELGYLSNKEDLEFLTTKTNYKQLAEAFTRAIDAYQLTKK